MVCVRLLKRWSSSRRRLKELLLSLSLSTSMTASSTARCVMSSDGSWVKILGDEATPMKYFFSTTAVWTLVGQALASKCSERRTQWVKIPKFTWKNFSHQGEPGWGARDLCGGQCWVEEPSQKVQCRQRGAVCQVIFLHFHNPDPLPSLYWNKWFSHWDYAEGFSLLTCQGARTS